MRASELQVLMDCRVPAFIILLKYMKILRMDGTSSSLKMLCLPSIDRDCVFNLTSQTVRLTSAAPCHWLQLIRARGWWDPPRWRRPASTARPAWSSSPTPTGTSTTWGTTRTREGRRATICWTGPGWPRGTRRWRTWRTCRRSWRSTKVRQPAIEW